ncbi:MAG: DUF1641 domain-containing protein [Bacteroidetes bacterium]|nr:DUF1641 domain-containing protein [Bacteroidota bacterium]MBT3748947.1 DUF1641 domain-containing protein [Bacteroidota bacterium]MBT4400332.1 DUF1641 domain-containing protein [Bacteroidota bacterium]MBT4408612.1 DUF1641 domain-containing protein [Bacteroidota bacterium]MBT7095369.1 DUF1641 domain-containing protein [Bacteroidota bacterium]
MSDQNIEQRIEALDHKVDLLLNYVNEQRLRAQSLDDLVADVSIVGKDIYDSAVTELDKQSVELDPSTITLLVVKLLKNIPNFSIVLEAFESLTDLAKDAGPIANEVIIDLTQKLHELDQKGYLEFFKESFSIIDKIVTHFSKEDVHLLADNITTILETVKSLTQPEMMAAMNNAVQVFNSVEQDNIPSYSLFKLMREMNQPEMKKALGFVVVFLKNLSNNNDA